MQTIRMKIDEERDLYNPLDPDGLMLSDDVKAYILEHLEERKLGQDVELIVSSEEALDEEKLRTALNEWVDDEYEDCRREVRRNHLQQYWMLGIGVVFIALSVAIEAAVGAVWYNIVSTIGAFSMWEAAGIWIIQNPGLRLRQRKILSLKEKLSLRLQTAGAASVAKTEEVL